MLLVTLKSAAKLTEYLKQKQFTELILCSGPRFFYGLPQRGIASHAHTKVYVGTNTENQCGAVT
ncbi:hypothetical protein BH11BAC6_BH11BAC6_02970 [soil metagenome]